ncbi:MAG: putative lipid II flippase FtsW [Elusimicrobiota bacterium]
MITPAKRRTRPPDYMLVGLTLVLLCAGLIMMGSASAILADRQMHDPFYFLKRQALFAVIGLGLMSALSRFDYNRLRRWVWPALAATAVLLVVVLCLPPSAGVRRWIRLGPLRLQPAEFAKLAVLLFIADYADRRNSRLTSAFYGLVVPMSLVCVILGLIGLEPDLGTPALICVVSIALLFTGGSKPLHILASLLPLLAVVAEEVWRKPYRWARFCSFLRPFEQAQGAGYQLAQSLIAVGSGGWLGKGLGSSQIKLLFLPAAHTDFIFPILCEELGLLGGSALLALFVAFLARGLKVARNAPNLFGTLLAAGITLMIVLQAYFNMAMAIGLIPTKGIPLPFFSYGGSSLWATLCSVGILLNISRQADMRTTTRT